MMTSTKEHHQHHHQQHKRRRWRKKASEGALLALSRDEERSIECFLRERRRGGEEEEEEEEEELKEERRREHSFIHDALEGIAAFDSVRDEEDRSRLFEAFVPLRYGRGECVVRQGDVGRNFYVIANGTCEVVVRRESMDENDDDFDGGYGDDFDGEGDEEGTRDDGCDLKIDAAALNARGRRIKNVIKRKEIGCGQTFGEVALLNPNVPIRSASVFAKSNRVTLWAIDSKTFGAILRATAFEKRARNESTLENVKFFADMLDDYEISLLADALSEEFVFEKGAVIMKRDDETAAKRMYFLCRGECEVRFKKNSPEDERDVREQQHEQHRTVKKLKPGSYFGDLSLLRGTPPTADVVATSDAVKVQWLDRGAFRRYVRADIVEALEKRANGYYMAPEARGNTTTALKLETGTELTTETRGSTPNLTAAPESSFPDERARNIEKGNITKNTLITHHLQRHLNVTNSVKSAFKSLSRRLRGEKGETKSSSSSSSATAVRTCAETLSSSVDDDTRNRGREYLHKQTRETTTTTTTSSSSSSHQQLLSKVSKRKHLTFHKQLGVGMTAAVFLCKTSDQFKHPCCVKVMRKKTLRDLDQVANVTRERELLRSFPNQHFVMQAMCSFQDDHFAYLVMEHMTGGDLFQLLVKGPFSSGGGAQKTVGEYNEDAKKMHTESIDSHLNTITSTTNTENNFGGMKSSGGGGFPLLLAKFYVAEVSCALQFLHQRNYIYRDLKPENVLIDRFGHCKLCDLGFTRKINPSYERCYTTCGTADYMAPEVTLRKGYAFAVDVWAVGVLLYELLTGKAPFAAKTDGERHQRIIRGDVRFPKTFNFEAKDIVSKMLIVDPSRRMTFNDNQYVGGEEKKSNDEILHHRTTFENHPFWAPFDWEEIKTKQMKPPFRPRTRPEKELFRKYPPLKEHCVEGLKPTAAGDSTKYTIANY